MFTYSSFLAFWSVCPFVTHFIATAHALGYASHVMISKFHLKCLKIHQHTKKLNWCTLNV